MLTCQRHLFNLPEEVAYLNCAYMSPNAKPVELAGSRALRQKNLPYEISTGDFFEPVARLKQLFSELIQAGDPDRVAIVPSVSYGLANVAKNLRVKPGQNIVMVEEIFPSNYYCWKRLADENQATLRLVKAPAFPLPGSQSRGEIWNRSLLEAIDEHTVLAALPHVHWADGTLFDLVAVREKTRHLGALLVVDGTQSVGALPFDLRKIQPDAMVCAGYKWLLGTYGLGLAWYGEYFDQGTPIEENWINRLNSENFQGLVNYQEDYRPKANRYCMGESSQFIAVPMLRAALELILGWGVENIQQYAADLSQPFFEIFREMGCYVETPTFRGGHLTGVRLPEGVNLEALKTAAQNAGVYVSFRGSAMRVSAHVFNNETDFDRLAGVLKKIRQ